MSRLPFSLLLYASCSLGQVFDHTHQSWDALLKNHVEVLSGGHASRVRYDGFARERQVLKAYLDALSGVGEAEFSAWSKARRAAFLINAYNGFMIEKILTRYPDLASVRDFGRIFGDPFKHEFFFLFSRKTSLNQIEHGMLRKPGAYDEPRVHFALNCASVGCPMLREESYVAERLDAQLEDQALRFLSDRSRNRVQGGRLEVSRIFDWYREDFGVRERYFSRYARQLTDIPAERDPVLEGKLPVTFLDYDWTLNASPSSSRR